VQSQIIIYPCFFVRQYICTEVLRYSSEGGVFCIQLNMRLQHRVVAAGKWGVALASATAQWCYSVQMHQSSYGTVDKRPRRYRLAATRTIGTNRNCASLGRKEVQIFTPIRRHGFVREMLGNFPKVREGLAQFQ